MHRRLASILVPTFILVAGTALAVPTQLSQQGRLLDGEGEPLEEIHSLTFSLYDAEIEGEVLRCRQAKTGSWFAHAKDDQLWLDRMELRLDDGELVVLNLDQFSVIEIE